MTSRRNLEFRSPKWLFGAGKGVYFQLALILGLERAQDALEIHRKVIGSDSAELAGYLVRQLTVLKLLHVFEEPSPEVQNSLKELEAEALDLVHHLMATGETAVLDTVDLLATQLEDEAEVDRLYRQALTLRRKVLQPSDPSLAQNLESVAEIAAQKATHSMEKNDPAAALPLYREALALRQQANPSRSRRVAETEGDLAWCLTSLGEYVQAEDLLIRSYRFARAELGDKSATTQKLLNRVIELYVVWDRQRRADEFRALLPKVAVRAIREVGPISFPAVEGAGRSFSTLFDNRSVWVMGNVRLARGQWRSSILKRTEDLKAQDGIDFGRAAELPTLHEFLPLTKAENSFNQAHLSSDCTEDCGARWSLWPGPVVVNPTSSQALIFYKKMFSPPPGVFVDHQTVGVCLAVWEEPNVQPQRPKLRGVGDPTILFSPEEPTVGSGALLVDNHLYAYACERDHLRRPCILARAPIARAFERRAWRFYVGSDRWSAEWKAAETVMEAAEVLSVHWNKHLEKYLAVYSTPLESTISIRTADKPEGPWSEVQIVIGTLAPPEFWSKWAVARPEFARAGGSVEYLTYYRDTGIHRGETRLVEIVFR